MNATTTRVFYVYQSPDKFRLPDHWETWGSREDAIRVIELSAGPGYRIVEIRPAFASRDEVAAELADYRDRLSVLPVARPITGVRESLRRQVEALEEELAAW